MTTSRERWEKERESLRHLTRVLAEEARGGVFGEALDHLQEGTGARAAVAFAPSGGAWELVAERGLPSAEGDACKTALAAVASQAAASRKLVQLSEVSAAPIAEEHREVLSALELRTLIALPIRYHREVLGVIVLLAPGPQGLGPGATAMMETAAHIVALAIERERREERELGYREDLLEAGQMASIGLLTATVALELRGPVAALGVQVDEQRRIIAQLGEAPQDDVAVRAGVTDLNELTDDIKAALAQIGKTIAQLTAMSQRDSAPAKVDLADVARQSLILARSDLHGRGIQIVEEHAPGCLTVGRRDNLQQVVLSLVFRAAEACTASGREPRITVRTRAEGSRVVLSVDDTGQSIPPEQIEGLFQPFFTGRDRQVPSRLALRIASDVVSAHRGHIEVVNLPEAGASFRVILPRMAPADATAATTEAPPSGVPTLKPTKPRRVLVVDDDDLFARTMKRALRPHEVRIAGTASEAELILLDPSYQPHLVLCDLGLPGLGGDALHARIKEKRPELADRFVFVTGGACGKREADYLRASGCATLLKPIDIDEIMTALANVHPSISVAPDGVETLRPELPVAVHASDAPTLPPPDTAPKAPIPTADDGARRS